MWVGVEFIRMVKKGEAQAKKVASKLRQGSQKKSVKKWTTVRFRKPVTKTLPREPKYPRVSVQPLKGLDKFSVIRQPLATEKAMKCIENHNTLVFLVDPKSTKSQIKKSAETLYSIHVKGVNTLIRPDGKKKAFVKLTPDYDALDVANKIGIL